MVLGEPRTISSSSTFSNTDGSKLCGKGIMCGKTDFCPIR